jgi:hypothetical protein
MINRLSIAMKSLFFLTALLLTFGCESKQSKPVTPAAQPNLPKSAVSKPAIRPIEGVSFSGGDGSSIEKAVIIKAPNNLVGIRGEYNWIRMNCPGWKLETQSTLKGAGKVYDKMYFLKPDGQRTILFFDVTDFYGKR